MLAIQKLFLNFSNTVRWLLSLLSLLLFSASASAGLFSDDLGFDEQRRQFLPANEAFISSIHVIDEQKLLATFTIKEGYYLYKDKVKFSASNDNVSIKTVSLPKGKIKDDPLFGKVEVFDHDVEIPIQFSRHNNQPLNLDITVAYQGCAEDGICYPPLTDQLPISLAAMTEATRTKPAPTEAQRDIAQTPLVSLENKSSQKETLEMAIDSESEPELSESDNIAVLLADKPLLISLAIFFGFGLALSLTPCVYPMIPILSGILVGQGANLTARKSFMLALVYVLGMALTYAVVGVVAGIFGHNLQAIFQNPWILGSFAGVFVLLAFSMFGFYDIQLPSSLQTRLTKMSDNQERGTLQGAGLMGIFSAIIAGPCVAPPLAGALIFIGQSGNGYLGGAALFVMGLGMGVPLLLLGASAGQLLPRAGVWMNVVKHVFGVMMLGVAIWLLERIIPGSASLALWGLLLIGSAVYMGAFDALSDVSTGWQRLWKALGLAMVLFGSLLIIGATSGSTDFYQPLKILTSSRAIEHKDEGLTFQKIKGTTGLNAALKSAADQNKPVMLDFYADWCKECIRMEKNTFTDKRVQQHLGGVILLQADVTPNDQADQELLQSLDLLGPPAILFYNTDGIEKRNFRITGYAAPEAFQKHVNKAFN